MAVLAEELARIDGSESTFLYGSLAARMLGDRYGTSTTSTSWCSVSPTILTPEEFAAPSGFLDTVRSGPAVAVIRELPWR